MDREREAYVILNWLTELPAERCNDGLAIQGVCVLDALDSKLGVMEEDKGAQGLAVVWTCNCMHWPMALPSMALTHRLDDTQRQWLFIARAELTDDSGLSARLFFSSGHNPQD